MRRVFVDGVLNRSSLGELRYDGEERKYQSIVIVTCKNTIECNKTAETASCGSNDPYSGGELESIVETCIIFFNGVYVARRA